MLRRKIKAFSLIELSVVILIIGILIAGVLAGSAMYNRYKITTAQQVTKNSEVSSIKDMVLWLEPVMDGSFAVTGKASPDDGDAVSTWYDSNTQSIRKLNFTQSSGSNKPLYKSSGIGGLPSLLFDGVNDLLYSVPAAIEVGTNQFTYFAVAQPTGAGAVANTVIFNNGCNCFGGRTGINFWNGEGGTPLAWGCGGAYDLNSSVTFHLNTPYAVVVTNTGSYSNNVTIYVNGTTTSGTKNISLLTDHMSVGAAIGNVGGANSSTCTGGTTPAYPFKGFISEIIVYSRTLTTEEITSVRSYLSKKYKFST